ncbi:hypothetical protein QSJ19_06250 [Gordonia sp. ABSL11-1]|uniref:hypothetical protein n=1 Tax=Gordonia sp. ABSL11-1 TaxID=3053924 RepID=UPI0025745699|nr:hypothetical protein [Gordonia sp. ABSL11-1]MDL9945198.1 hypothetical protein [Gordonia sp. ABSL11-1]
MIASLIGFAAPSAAAPGDPPPPMSLQDLGSSSTISFPGQQGEVSMSLPVPQNLTPSVLRGLTELPAFVTGGSVDVLQDERLISRTPINPEPNSPIELPLRGLRVDQNGADIVLRAYLRVEGLCQFDPENAFRMVNATVSYTGREAIPDSVAEFLPPILRGLTIYIPDDVQQAEGAAAVNLATAVVANYGAAQVPIRTVALPRSNMTPPTVPGPLERQIVINTQANPGLSLQSDDGSAYLVIGGSADELVTQTQFLTSNMAPIALSSAAVAGSLHNAPQIAPSVQTLGDLGIGDQSVTSASWPTIDFGIDQTRLGRPSKSISVQLSGSYSPGPRDSDGLVAVRSGDRTIATIPTDESGSYNQWVDIPDDVVRRYTPISLVLQRGDLSEGCGNGYRSTLSLSSSGEVRSEAAADPPQPQGFQSLPQSLMPRTQLAWTKGDVGDVSRAVSIAAGLQGMSAVPLGLDVVSMDSASSSDQPAILISADGTGLPSLDLPLRADGRKLSVVSPGGGSSSVTLDPGISFGALEVTRSGDRSVLVATSTNDSGDLDSLLDYLSTDQRWGEVDGDAVMKIAGNDPVAVNSTAINPESEDTRSTGSWGTVVGVLVGAAILVGAVIGGTLLVRRRRERSAAG